MPQSVYLKLLSDPVQRLRIAMVAIPLLLAAGTLGYVVLADLSPFDAFYMTMITFSTVGYGEVGELTLGARVMTVFLIGAGMFLVAFTTASFIESIVEGELARYLGRKRVQAKIDLLEDHWVICGYGRMGQLVAQSIASSKDPPRIVVVDQDPQRILQATAHNLLHVDGDATDEESLRRAGIGRAAGLVSLVATDAQNVFICLTARGINPKLTIIARALEERTEDKLRRAGADKVVSPYVVGGHRLSQAVLQPVVAEFLEFAAGNDLSLEMEQTVLEEGSSLCDVELRHSGLRRELNLIVLAIRSAKGEMIFNPGANTRLQAGDTLIAMGASKSLRALNERARGG